MRRGAPFSMGSTVRDDPRRFGHLRDALYAFRMEKILAPLGTAVSARVRTRGRGSVAGTGGRVGWAGEGPGRGVLLIFIRQKTKSY